MEPKFNYFTNLRELPALPSSWRCAREGRVKPEVRVVANPRPSRQNRVGSGRIPGSVFLERELFAPGPPLGAQNWPTVRGILKNQTPKSSLFKAKGRGLRAANMYIFSVENKRNLRTDGPQFWLAIRPTSILAIGGNFASGPPPGRSNHVPKPPETPR